MILQQIDFTNSIGILSAVLFSIFIQECRYIHKKGQKKVYYEAESVTTFLENFIKKLCSAKLCSLPFDVLSDEKLL